MKNYYQYKQDGDEGHSNAAYVTDEGVSHEERHGKKFRPRQRAPEKDGFQNHAFEGQHTGKASATPPPPYLSTEGAKIDPSLVNKTRDIPLYRLRGTSFTIKVPDYLYLKKLIQRT